MSTPTPVAVPSNAMQPIFAGFSLLKRERSANIQAHGIPEQLLKSAEQVFEKISPEMAEKLNKAYKLYNNGTTVFFLTGDESPDKNVFAVLLLMMMLGSGKVVRYYIATSFDAHDVGQMAIMGVDMAKGLASTKIVSALTTHIHNYKAAVISGETLASIETALGKSLYDYMAHMAVDIKIPTTRDKIIEV